MERDDHCNFQSAKFDIWLTCQKVKQCCVVNSKMAGRAWRGEAACSFLFMNDPGNNGDEVDFAFFSSVQ